MHHHDPRVIARIVSGGQTGADRAALDAAVAQGVEHGGWCPAGGRAEDLPDPPGLLTRYPCLRETETTDPRVRTLLNVRDSHATLVVIGPGTTSPGTDLARRTARELGRPLLVTDGSDVDAVADWVGGLGGTLDGGLTLNVAGPRESEEPGIYAHARRLVEAVLSSCGAST